MLLGKVVEGKYRVLKLIGSGGMGQVFLARDVGSGISVALKTARPELKSDINTLARLEQEIACASILRHENICESIGSGKLPDNTPYYVMPLLVGTPLSARIKKRKLDQEEAVDMAIPVLRGLETAHCQQIVHRDLKPSNIFLSRGPGGKTVVKLLDFGASKELGESQRGLTRTGIVVGTSAYMAPEQAAGKEVDHRVDIYAVGVVLYEALTGQKPFDATSREDIRQKIVTAPYKSPRSVDPSISRAMEALILRAMSKRPDKRFHNAVEMRHALARVSVESDEARSTTQTADIKLADVFHRK